MEALQVKQQSSLEKVFSDAGAFGPEYLRASALRGEELAYQIVLRKKTGGGMSPFTWSLDSPLKEWIRVFRVEQVPCGLPAYPDRNDEDYLSRKPGLFPDLLCPLGEQVEISSFENTTLWINIALPPDCPAGEYPITFTAENGTSKGETVFTLEVIPAALPPQELLFTQWFHADCLATWYGVPVWSEEHWKIVENYLREAAREGMNTVLTPLFTPALDTEVGAERPCVQLLDAEREGDTYRFGFERLRRFVETALSCGVTHFEISHLFTQWGAAATPNIYVMEQGEKKRVFGWDVPAGSPEYASFLRQLLPELLAFFRALGLQDRLLFHISDEPSEEHLETYRKNKELVEPLLEGAPLIDALSSPSFYDRGLVEHPVAAIDHIEPFLERKVPGLWAYNCCSQCVDVGNRFLAMPSHRNRIIGLQLYKYHIAGFLHWGYNFWYSQYSRRPVDPFRITDGGGAFPGGDPFSVYPGERGEPLPSLRQKVFYHGLQDQRALVLLESLSDRQTVERTVPGFDRLTFSRYPRDPQFLLETREAVNRKIAELL